MVEPTINERDAADVCARPWPTLAEALEQARILERAGWSVRTAPVATPGQHIRRPDGSRLLASVYHPTTGESPGDVTYQDDRSRSN